MHIYVPEDAFKKNITELPVLFWIFGGGFVMGDGYEFGFYDGSNLAKNTNSIVVTTNYRVGPFGFLAHKYLQNEDPDHSTGNMGVRDQRAAMQIVQEIIGEFETHKFTIRFKRLAKKELNDFQDKEDYEALKTIIVGWSDIKDEEDKDIPFSQKNLKDFSEDVDFVQGVVKAFQTFYTTADEKN